MLEGLMVWLGSLGNNPTAYLLFFYIFCILAAIILPIPVELGLLGIIAQGFMLYGLPVFPSYVLLGVVMGLGKATGGWLVFLFGLKIEKVIHTYERWRWFKWLVKKSTWLASKATYIGLYLILIIPGMADTIPLYIFSMLNKDGKVFEMRWFVLTNFFAGLSRALLVGIIVSTGINWAI